jgi:Siphovirus Gp157.
MNLYEINSQIENFEFKIDEETGEVLNMNELNELKMSKDEKIENIALWIKNLKSDEKALDDEIKTLQARKKAKKSKIDNLSSYLESVLNGSKFDKTRVSISFRKSSSVVIDDEKGFIDVFSETDMVSQTVKMSINKKAVKEYLKDNISAYAHIEEKQNIQIK